MQKRVLKFGGAALRDGDAVRRAARIALATAADRTLCVVSAHEGVTDLLERSVREARSGRLEWDSLRIRHRTLLRQLELPGDLLDRHLFELRSILSALTAGTGVERHMRDFVLSFGERMSARVFTAVLRRMGAEATPLDAYDLGLVSEGGLLARPDQLARSHGRATPERSPRSIGESLLSVPGIPVVTGFLALDDAGHLTTLGPNGSDLSAVWFGEAIGASEVQLWKTVAGVLTADPKLVPHARTIPALSWSDAAELAAHGSEIVHPAALEPARRASLCVRVLDVTHPTAEGSRIEGDGSRAGPVGLAHRSKVALFRKRFDPSRSRTKELSELFERLSAVGAEPYVESVTGQHVTALLPDGPEVAGLSLGDASAVSFERGLSSVAVVGSKLEEDARLSAALQALRRDGVRLMPVPRDPCARSYAVLSSRAEHKRVLEFLHRRLFERDVTDAPGSGSIAAGTVHP